MENKSALVLGATGLTGRILTEKLLQEPAYGRIVIPTRKPSGFSGPKIQEYMVDVTKLEEHTVLFEGIDDIFCCTGTTMKKAGSREAFHRVDYDIPVKAAKYGQMHASRFFLVSSIGANPSSSAYYLRVKGEVEKQLLQTTFSTIHILRPSLLLGKREEKRGAENLWKRLSALLKPLMVGGLRPYRGIQAETVAEAMHLLSLTEKKGKYIYESDDIERLVSQRKKNDTFTTPSI